MAGPCGVLAAMSPIRNSLAPSPVRRGRAPRRARRAGAATVEPVFYDGNPTCADLGYAHEIKFDPPSRLAHATASPST